MTAGLVEIVGVFIVFVGLCAVVAAASLISPILALFVAGVLLVVVGIIAVYVASALERKPGSP